MKKPLKALALTALAAGTIAGVFCTAHRGQASVGTCTERFMVIGSRGSGNDFGDDPITDKYGEVIKGIGTSGNAFAAAFADKFPRGQVTFLRNYYPAKGGLVSLLGAITRLGPIGAYKASVAEGRHDLKGLIARQINDCPKVKLVLVGYSQGAQVTGDVYQGLPAGEKRHVAGVVLFGDPEFNPNDPADRSQYDKSEHGALGNRGIFSSGDPVFSYCHTHDPVCQWPLTNPRCRHPQSIGCKALVAVAVVYRFTKHENYTSLGEPQEAANKLAEQVGKPASWGNNTQSYIGKTRSGYTGRVTVTAQGVFHTSHLPPLPISGRTYPDNCQINDSTDGVVEVTFSVTNLSKGLTEPISVMPIAESEQGYLLYLDSGGCWESTLGELMVRGNGQSLRGDYFVIIPNYFSPGYAQGNTALAKSSCTSVNAWFGNPGTASFQQLWPANRLYGLPLLRGGKGCGP